MSMDKIYLPKIDCPTVHLAERLAALRSEIARFPGPDARQISAKTALNWQCSSAAFAELEASVSLDQLGSPHDLRIRPYNLADYRPPGLSRYNLPKSAVQTLRTLTSLYSYRERSDSSRKTGRRRIKNTDHRIPCNVMYNRQNVDVTASTLAADIQPGEELLVVIRIYEPFKYVVQKTRRARLRLKQRITLLGSQTLDELRDLIQCTCTQHGPFHDISERAPSTEPANASMAASSSSSAKPDPGFFFITDTFYTDARDDAAAAEAYTQPIREWAARRPDEVGAMQPRTLQMQQTRWSSLRFRIGAPHVYQHYGNCEHVFTVADVRLIAATGDSRMRRDYPVVDRVALANQLRCVMCGLADADVVVMDSVVHVSDPAFLCNGCFETSHFVDGKKVGEFRAYAYINDRKATLTTDDGIVVQNEPLGEQEVQKM